MNTPFNMHKSRVSEMLTICENNDIIQISYVLESGS